MEPTVEQMKQELAEKEDVGSPTRVLVNATGPGGVTGIKVPRHMLEGSRKLNKAGVMSGVFGMKSVDKARAKVYGSENRPPLNIGQAGRIHKNTLDEHFQKPLNEQMATENAALGRLRAAQHIGKTANTLDKSEKLDTVNHEHDEKGRAYIGFASKGVAGHALYSSGAGKDQKYHVINTCPGQTAGCGGGTDEHGVVDTMKGTCFAPNAESQYPAASVRRASHEQAKHDPAMTQDWILAHTGSLRNAARLADRSNKRLLFRPNVVDETDVSSRHVIKHLNKQRAAENKPPITANSYGKTNEMHDPANGYYVTHSNIGPKVKKGAAIQENIDRDKQRISRTVDAAAASGKDFVNDEGEKTPPKNSYMVTDVKRHSPFDKKMQGAITHAKYWSTGREAHELSKDEREEGPEGHFGPNGKPTTPDKAHFGHETHEGQRFDYQKQHILHPRLVNVPERKKNKKTGKMETVEHMIPTDSRFKDDEFLPKNRFKTKNGKVAGAIVMTTPTESTSNVGHQTSFTHHVGEHHIEHALKNNGEYQIDTPQEQIAAKGKEYVTPQPIKFVKRLATGGSVINDNEEFDGHMAFPEQSFAAQHRLAYRHDPEEVGEIGHRPYLAGAKHIRAMASQHKAFQKPEPRRMAEGGTVGYADGGATDQGGNLSVNAISGSNGDSFQAMGNANYQTPLDEATMLRLGLAGHFFKNKDWQNMGIDQGSIGINRQLSPNSSIEGMLSSSAHPLPNHDRINRAGITYNRTFADGGSVKADEPSHDEMLAHIMLHGMSSLKDIGANEAPNMKVKTYVPQGSGPGMPVGGVDFQPETKGQQMLPGQPGQPPQAGAPQGGPPPGAPPPAPAPGGPQSNILQMTPQGQAMAAMRATPPPGMPPPKMATGGTVKDYIRITERKL